MDAKPIGPIATIDHETLLRNKYQIQKQVDYQDQKLRFLDMPKIPFRHASIIRENFKLITEENHPIDNMLLCNECKTVHAFRNKNHGNLLRHVKLHEKLHGTHVSQECLNRARAEHDKEIKSSKKRSSTPRSKVERVAWHKAESGSSSVESPKSPAMEEKTNQQPIEIPSTTGVMVWPVTREDLKQTKKKPQRKSTKKLRLLMKLPCDSLNSPPILNWQA